MSKTIEINGVDFTNMLTPVGQGVAQKKIRGSLSGYMQDGSYTDDVIARKSVLTCTVMPLNESDLNRLLQAIDATYVYVRFFDPRVGGYRTAEMMPNETQETHRGIGTNGLDYWTGAVLEFTER